jgi:hypothetical protein
MKVISLILLFGCVVSSLISLSGCRQKVDARPDEPNVTFENDLEKVYQQAVRGGSYRSGLGEYTEISTADIANVRLLYANYKSSQKLRAAIEEFDRSSTALANKMLYLTIVIAVLTLIMALLTFVQVANHIWRFLAWMRKKVRIVSHNR